MNKKDLIKIGNSSRLKALVEEGNELLRDQIINPPKLYKRLQHKHQPWIPLTVQCLKCGEVVRMNKKNKKIQVIKN